MYFNLSGDDLISFTKALSSQVVQLLSGQEFKSWYPHNKQQKMLNWHDIFVKNLVELFLVVYILKNSISFSWSLNILLPTTGVWIRLRVRIHLQVVVLVNQMLCVGAPSVQLALWGLWWQTILTGRGYSKKKPQLAWLLKLVVDH